MIALVKRRTTLLLLVPVVASCGLAVNGRHASARTLDPIEIPRCPVVSDSAVRVLYPRANKDSFYREPDGVFGTVLLTCSYNWLSGSGRVLGGVTVDAFCGSPAARARVWKYRVLNNVKLLGLRAVRIGLGGYLEYHGTIKYQDDPALLRFKSAHAALNLFAYPIEATGGLAPFMRLARKMLAFSC